MGFQIQPGGSRLRCQGSFQGTDWEIQIPEGREGSEGLRDALDVIDMMANHLSTREFICVQTGEQVCGG